MLEKKHIAEQVAELENSIGRLAAKDQSFAHSLCESYRTQSFLSEKQQYWVRKLLERTGSYVQEGGTSSGAQITEVFNGAKIRDLFVKAGKKLKYPKLRYTADGGSKIIFSYAKAPRTEKWKGYTFIDNGLKYPSQTRYGSIDSYGRGYLDRTSKQEIKTLIRKIADNPTELAKLQGQEFKNCCFCGLELTNKSSVYHGYGPICADNWGLPWGDTGSIEDDEAAAVEEMKHITLHDLE